MAMGYKEKASFMKTISFTLKKHLKSSTFAAEKKNMNKGPISQFITHHYRHFNAAALVDSAKGYEEHLLEGGKMMVTLAGAMSTAELGVSLAEMIRRDKLHIISYTGANL